MVDIEEKNTHVLRAEGDHVTGIYQWVEKVYEAQIFNYGIRSVYEFIVPEPAAMLIEALQRKRQTSATAIIAEPLPFTATAAQLSDDTASEHSYHAYAARYEATGLAPPPERHTTVAHTFGGKTEQDAFGRHASHTVLDLPPDYQAVRVHVTHSASRTEVEEDSWALWVSVGRHRHRFGHGDDATWHLTLAEGDDVNERAKIPLWIRTTGVGTYAVAFEIECVRTERAYAQWQQSTHGLILQAYQARRREFQEGLVALEAAAGVEISGRHAEANRTLERSELRRCCVALLTQQSLPSPLFDSIFDAGAGLQLMPLDADQEEEARIIRFCEQAFEWHTMTYLCYPYFWGRPGKWLERITYVDANDPLFESFLKAGAARVVVPVRPGFEMAVDHFLATGDPWIGGEIPDVASELYVPIVQELRESLGAPGDEVAQGAPWSVTLPTSLVLLRSDGSLPRWRKNEDGAWIPE